MMREKKSSSFVKRRQGHRRALRLLRRQSDIEVAGLFTTVNERLDREAMHDYGVN
jgi:hypothetical protein